MSVGTVSKQVCDGVTGPSVSCGVGGGERVFLEVPRVPRPALPSPLVIWKLGREGALRGARGAPGPLLTSPPHNHGDRAAASPPRLHLIRAPGPPGLLQQLSYWQPSHSWPATSPVNGIVDVHSRIKVMRVIQGTRLEVTLRVKLVTEGASRLFFFGLV